jgi:aerobic C4-dicarboxylate transport protein
VVVSRWEGRLDHDALNAALHGRAPRIDQLPADAVPAE